MDPTGLPTDSVYKLMATSGLVIMAFSVWFYWTRRRQFWADQKQLRRELALLQAKLKSLRARHATLKQKAADGVSQQQAWSRTVAALRAKFPLDQIADEVADAQAHMQRLADQVVRDDATSLELQAEIDAASAEADALQVTANSQLNERAQLMWLKLAVIIACILGAILSTTGFVQWYRHLQYYTDRQAKAEFEDKMAELALKRRARDNACWKEQHANPPVPFPSACPYPEKPGDQIKKPSR